jgi:hypothetical protein
MKPKIIEITSGGYYIPMDGPWGSEEDNAAFKAAENKFNECVAAEHMYVALIQSHHEYSHGYWIEIKGNIVKYPDRILKVHGDKPIGDKNSDSRDQPVP